MTLNWPALWKRDETLRPRNMRREGTINDEPVYERTDMNDPPNADDVEYPTYLPVDLTSDLCCMAAVRWLAERRGNGRTLARRVGGWSYWTVCPDADGDPAYPHMHPTLEAALYAAVDAVLTSEGK